MSAGIVVAIIAAIAAPLVAYLVAARQFSGKIETSDATDLWAESKSIREWSQERVVEVTAELKSVKGRMTELEGANDTLHRENIQLRDQVHELNNIIVELRQEIAELTTKLQTATKKISELEGTNGSTSP